MPLEIIDLDNGLGNLITARGVLSENEFLETLIKHLTQDKDKLKKYRYSLGDYTGVTEFNVSTQAIETIASYCRSAAKNNPDAIVATIAKSDLLFGMARMSEILRGDTGWEESVVRDIHEAKEWIKKRVKEKYGIEDITFS